mgnify:CR=1 FL=1
MFHELDTDVSLEEMNKRIKLLKLSKSAGPDNYLTGPDNYLTGPDNYLTGPDNYLTGPDNYLTGPDNYLTGPDNYLNEYFIHGNTVLIPYLQSLFNVILKTSYFPETWSEGYIVPLHKKGLSIIPTITGV